MKPSSNKSKKLTPSHRRKAIMSTEDGRAFMIENGYARGRKTVCEACQRSSVFCICTPTVDSQEAIS